MKRSEQLYWYERNKILGVRNFRNFAQISGEHAVHLCDLNIIHKNKQLKPLLSKWVEIHENIKEWTNRVSPEENCKSSETLHKVTNDLLKTYTECLADYILDKTGTPEWKQKLNNLVDKESLFFNALGNGRDTKRYWLAYTESVVNMIDVVEKYGLNSSYHYDAAADVIVTGRTLGQWLDHILQ